MIKQINNFNKIQFLNGGKGLDTKTLQVKHASFPENEIAINADAWCDIGGHKVPEWSLQNLQGDAQVCEGCFDHFS